MITLSSCKLRQAFQSCQRLALLLLEIPMRHSDGTPLDVSTSAKNRTRTTYHTPSLYLVTRTDNKTTLFDTPHVHNTVLGKSFPTWVVHTRAHVLTTHEQTARRALRWKNFPSPSRIQGCNENDKMLSGAERNRSCGWIVSIQYKSAPIYSLHPTWTN
jgi:hypothetical protein